MKHIFRFLILLPFFLLPCSVYCFWQRIEAKHLVSHLLCILSYYCNLAVASRLERQAVSESLVDHNDDDHHDDPERS